MRIERLVEMANDIAAFFDAKADKAEAARDIARHLRLFWDPRMRRELIAHYRQGGHGLNPTALSAVGMIAAGDAATVPQAVDQ
jgi:formate dehydrogenase subunit delta